MNSPSQLVKINKNGRTKIRENLSHMSKQIFNKQRLKLKSGLKNHNKSIKN